MKLTHLALILTLGMLGVTGWIAWSEHSNNTGIRNKLDLYERHGQPELEAKESQMVLDHLHEKTGTGASAAAPLPSPAPGAGNPYPTAAPAVYAPAAPPAYAAAPPSAQGTPPPALQNTPHVSQYSLQAQPPPLTPQQRQVQNAPAIAKVSQYQQQYGFVVVTAGANRRLEKGMSFAVRHDGFVVGRITITEVEDDSAVGDLDGKSVPEGVTIETGDDVIQAVPTS